MEHVQEDVARMTLETLISLHKTLPSTKQFRQIRAILKSDIADVKKELKQLQRGDALYFTNVTALSHMMAANAMVIKMALSMQ